MAQTELTLDRHCALVTCGQEVKRGQCIATANGPGQGDIHTPMSGKVVHVDAYRVRIAPEGNETVAPVDLSDLTGEELRAKLLTLGADLPEGHAVDTLIINGVDAEQDIVTRRSLLADCSAILETGIAALDSVYAPGETVLAVPQGSPHQLSGLNTAAISEQYPSGLDPLVAKAVTGQEAPENTIVIGLEILFHVGQIMETGLPALETMVTIGEEGRIVSLGTPVGSILDQTGEIIRDRDRIVLGGILRGKAAGSPTQGVDRSTYAVSVVSNPAPVARDAACVGCGECVRRCPARLDPAMITSYAEFGMYDKAAQEGVDACFECGLCGFFCIARRPMLQYIRLAKNELAKAKALSAEENQQ